MTVAVVVLSSSGAATARRIAAALPDAELHGLSRRVTDADVPFTDTTAHLRSLFRYGTPIVGVCAAAILIRALAPLLTDKTTEPPVLAVSADGASVVPLLGGHQGANRLALHLAEQLGGQAAVTTAGEVGLGIALDDPPDGWGLAPGSAVKPVAAALLAGEPVRLTMETGAADWLALPNLGETGTCGIRVTDRAAAPGPAEIVYHPQVLAIGVGCARGTTPEELIALVRRALDGFAEAAVACVVSIDLKADEPAVHAVAAQLGVPARFFDAARLEREAPRLANPSEAVFRETGCHGVAEGAALAAAGTDGTLLRPKIKSNRATCAIARAARPIDTTAVGRARGRLAVVGIGPGDPAWRTPEVSRALTHSSDLVGYRLYLDLLGTAASGKIRHDGELGGEEARVRRALDLAAEGRDVALVCSGDAGIYALAALVFELLEREARPEWQRLDLAVMPGVSALQAAASRAGAVIGHDFCAVSLSDLLTPWAVIENRLRAAASGDFVVALFNPLSQRRRDQLPAALRILSDSRPPSTPVVLARNLGREGESVTVTSLADVDPAQVDMLTVVLVGNSETRRLHRGGRTFVYTPRGYGNRT